MISSQISNCMLKNNLENPCLSFKSLEHFAKPLESPKPVLSYGTVEILLQQVQGRERLLPAFLSRTPETIRPLCGSSELTSKHVSSPQRQEVVHSGVLLWCDSKDAGERQGCSVGGALRREHIRPGHTVWPELV